MKDLTMKPVLFAGLVLAACTPAATAEPYPFEGRWDCEVAEFTFTATTYNPGDQELEILDIAQDDNQYTLTFADNYQVFLTMGDDGTMAWLSSETGDGFLCKPLP
jgi:hypothetical protein